MTNDIGLMSQRADRARDLALADGAQPLLALLVADAVDSTESEEEFFETIDQLHGPRPTSGAF